MVKLLSLHRAVRQEPMDVNTAEYWSERYRRGETGWDLGAPTPVFAELLRRGGFPLPPHGADRATRVLVPGCGYGHDALLLASAGYEVIAVDFAPEAISALRQRTADLGLSLQALQADLFALPQLLQQPVDMVLEYTCYCAIAPERRPEYFRTVAQVLVPGGWLVALFFPLQQSGAEPLSGPPFPVDPNEILTLAERAGLRLHSRELPDSSHPARRGREELWMLYKPMPTDESSPGTH